MGGPVSIERKAVEQDTESLGRVTRVFTGGSHCREAALKQSFVSKLFFAEDKETAIISQPQNPARKGKA